MRASRLGIHNQENIFVVCEVELERTFSHLQEQDLSPSLVIIDSIQTMSTESCPGSIGSISQIRESTSKLVQYAKTNQVPVILIGHVTKTGEVAGPKVLEHMVDTVISLDGSEKSDYRILKCEKNRFGSASEVGLFTMTETGMTDVTNPSELFLTEKVIKESQEGSSVVITLEGSRCILAEVQCLVGSSNYNPNGKTITKRTSDGFPLQRLLLLCAVIEKRLKLPLWNRDVFLNVVGGLTISEPSADLAVAISVISSLLSVPVYPATAFIGELGLGGEIRGTKRMEQRILEAVKIGFRRIVLPAGAYKKGNALEVLKQKMDLKKIELVPCQNLLEAVEQGLQMKGRTLDQIRSAIRRGSNKRAASLVADETDLEEDREFPSL